MGVIDPGGEIISNTSNRDLQRYFWLNLEGIDDGEVRGHVAQIMVEHTERRRLKFLSDGLSDSERFDQIWKSDRVSERYGSFRQVGDTYLWMAGFFPGYAAKARRASLGIRHYIESGRTAYQYAVSARANLRVSGSGLCSRLATDFEGLTKSLFELRMKTDPSVVTLPGEVVEEVSEAMYRGAPIRLEKLADRVPLRVVGH